MAAVVLEIRPEVGEAFEIHTVASITVDAVIELIREQGHSCLAGNVQQLLLLGSVLEGSRPLSD
jgi:hypothetical protein